MPTDSLFTAPVINTTEGVNAFFDSMDETAAKGTITADIRSISFKALAKHMMDHGFLLYDIQNALRDRGATDEEIKTAVENCFVYPK